MTKVTKEEVESYIKSLEFIANIPNIFLNEEGRKEKEKIIKENKEIYDLIKERRRNND